MCIRDSIRPTPAVQVEDEEGYFALVRAAFGQRRKTAANAIASGLGMPKDAVTEYLRAIACSRLGRKAEGREHFLEACRLDGRMEYRGNLDPEIAELLKQ